LDDSKVRRAEAHDYTGAVVEHLRVPGAHVSRIMHPPGQRIGAHAHDWPVLTLYRIGSYREEGEAGARAFDGPSVVFQPAGAAHADEIGASGLETLAMTFDPDWLTPAARMALPRHTVWQPGGTIAVASRRLAGLWTSPHAGSGELRVQTSVFLLHMWAAPLAPRPSWADHVQHSLHEEATTRDIANDIACHPAWLARAYRAWRGEGMGETVRRRRVERATLRLRGGNAPLADIAAECGFCDQSHMNRAFRAVLGRTPLEVRLEAALLMPLAASG
jgi:AraC family transcriptional regulator